jgi:predicted nucleic acid-binding protein
MSNGLSSRRKVIALTRYVIGPDVALRLARDEAVIATGCQLVAPTLLRSQVLTLLYESVQRGELTRKDADRQLDYIRGLRIRLLGDRVLQRVAWKIADQFGRPDTYAAEYLALTQLQADAFITLDSDLAKIAKKVVTVAPFEDLQHHG